MKIIKFPEHKIRKPWLRKLENTNKTKWIGFMFSFASVLLSLALTWFVLHKMNL